MTTYLLPCFHPEDGCWIEKVRANGFNSAKEKFIKNLSEDCGLDADDWDSLIDCLAKIDVSIGDIYDIEEF